MVKFEEFQKKLKKNAGKVAGKVVGAAAEAAEGLGFHKTSMMLELQKLKRKKDTTSPITIEGIEARIEYMEKWLEVKLNSGDSSGLDELKGFGMEIQDGLDEFSEHLEDRGVRGEFVALQKWFKENVMSKISGKELSKNIILPIKKAMDSFANMFTALVEKIKDSLESHVSPKR